MVFDIRFYLDTAGGKPDTPTIAAAGYLAREAEWQGFERAWSRILDDSEADEFHATDFYACRKKFKHLVKGSARHLVLERRFLNAALKYPRVGLGFGFNVETYRLTMTDCLLKTKLPYGEGMDPRVYALSYALNRAAQRVLPRGTETAVVFEYEKGIGRAIDYLNYLKAKRHEGWTGAYTTFTHAPKSERRLQAADLLAYHSCLYIRDLLRTPTVEVSASMKRLLRRKNLRVDMAAEPEFRQSAKGVIDFLRANPAYAVRAATR